MNARLRANVLRFKAPQPVPKPVRNWGVLAEPVHAIDNESIARAKSLLSEFGHIDITPSQARDVCAWACNWRVK